MPGPHIVLTITLALVQLPALASAHDSGSRRPLCCFNSIQHRLLHTRPSCCWDTFERTERRWDAFKRGDCFWSTRTSIVASNENVPPSLEQKRADPSFKPSGSFSVPSGGASFRNEKGPAGTRKTPGLTMKMSSHSKVAATVAAAKAVALKRLQANST